MRLQIVLRGNLMYTDVKHSGKVIGIRNFALLFIDFNLATIRDRIPVILYIDRIFWIVYTVLLPWLHYKSRQICLPERKLNKRPIVAGDNPKKARTQ